MPRNRNEETKLFQPPAFKLSRELLEFLTIEALGLDDSRRPPGDYQACTIEDRTFWRNAIRIHWGLTPNHEGWAYSLSEHLTHEQVGL